MKKQWVGCAPSNFRRGRPTGMKPEMIVLHTLKTSLTEADARFASSGSLVSAHYAVGRQGEVHQYVEETDPAFHAGSLLTRGLDWCERNPGPIRTITRSASNMKVVRRTHGHRSR